MAHRGPGEQCQVGVDGVDVGFLQVRKRRHALAAFLNSLVEIGPRSSGLRARRRSSGRRPLLLQVLSHQLERRSLHEPENRLDLRRGSRAFGPVAGLTVQPVQVGAAQFNRPSNRQRHRAWRETVAVVVGGGPYVAPLRPREVSLYRRPRRLSQLGPATGVTTGSRVLSSSEARFVDSRSPRPLPSASSRRSIRR